MGSIYKRGTMYWIKYYAIDPESGRTRALRESSGSVRHDDAKTLLRQREGAIAGGTVITPQTVRLTFSEAARAVVNDYRANGKRSLHDVTRNIARHLEPFLGRRRMTSITPTDVRHYITHRQAEGAKNATINRELAALKRAFNLAIAAGSLSARPPIPMLREDNVRKGFFEAEQFGSVCAALAPDLADFVRFLYLTGWRWCSEAAELKWSNIEFDAGEVRLDPGTTKTGEGRVFPFTRELRVLLERRFILTREREKSLERIIPFVFHRAHGLPIRSFRKAWGKACRAAGVPGRVPHDFRRTAVRNLVRRGIPEKVAMTMVGWKSRQMLDRYNVVSREDLHDAARRLDHEAAVGSPDAGAIERR